MTVPAPRARRRPSTLGRLLPLLLIGALLAPMGLLVASNWRLTTDDRDLAARERLGVQYLRALGPGHRRPGGGPVRRGQRPTRRPARR